MIHFTFLQIVILFSVMKNALFTNLQIIGGQTATPKFFRFAAAISVQTSNSKFFCAGSLLSQEWILTAGQCVNGATRFNISFGSISLIAEDPNRVSVSTTEYILHEEFNATTLWNDIALIKLAEPINYTDYILPVDRLPIAEVCDHCLVFVYGWGQTSDNDTNVTNDLLQWVRILSLTNAECAATYGSQITDKMVCAKGKNNEGSCFGDTGGSLVQYYTTGHPIPIGITSFFSSNGCENSDPAGYTRVFPYNDWIRNKTGLDI